VEITPGGIDPMEKARGGFQMWEYKFVFRDDRITPALFRMIGKLEEIAGYRCRPTSEVVYNDFYFDSDDLFLDCLGTACRIRSEGTSGKYGLSVKREAVGPDGKVVYIETEPIPIGRNQFRRLLRGNFSGDYEKTLETLAGLNKLRYLLNLRVARTILALSNDSGDLMGSLNMDRIEAFLPANPRTPIAVEYEMELKSSKERFPEANILKDYLRAAFNPIPAENSKLRRFAHMIPERRGDKQPRKVLLDMDTGVDDALAILFAMSSPEIEVLGITTTSGNADAVQAARNSAAVLHRIQKTVASYSKDFARRYSRLPPIASSNLPGASTHGSPGFHGEDGFGGVGEKHFDPSFSIETDALALFKRIVREHEPGEITLITTGPLSNLSDWIERAPETVKRLREVISVGGVFFGSGNITQAAEFNIHADPASARRVVEFCREPVSQLHYRWRETLPLTFIGLDVTRKVRFQRKDLTEAIENLERRSRKASPAREIEGRLELLRFIEEFTREYMDFYYRSEGLDGCYLHDPLSVGFAINPSLYQREQYHVEIEDRGILTSGMTIADYRPTRFFKDRMKESTWICYKVNTGAFQKLFLERITG
jgi:purine nucleosidase